MIRPLRRRQPQPHRSPRRQVPDSPHLAAIVEWIHQHRLSTADQVQRRFAGWIGSHRTTRRKLGQLVEGGLLDLADVRSTSPNFPHVYVPTGRGLRYVAEARHRHGLPWREDTPDERKSSGRALLSILHELLITEFELNVWQTVESREDLSLLATERRYFRPQARLSYYEHGRPRHVEPDAGFLLRVHQPGSPSWLQQNFVELDNGTMPIRRMMEKLQRYDRWARSDPGERYLCELYQSHGTPQRPIYRLLVIAHDKDSGNDGQRLTQLLVAAAGLPRNMRDRVWLASAGQLRAATQLSQFATPVWMRARAPSHTPTPHPLFPNIQFATAFSRTPDE